MANSGQGTALPKLYTTTEAAEILGMSLPALQIAINRRKSWVPRDLQKLGRQWRFTEAQIQACLKQPKIN